MYTYLRIDPDSASTLPIRESGAPRGVYVIMLRNFKAMLGHESSENVVRMAI